MENIAELHNIDTNEGDVPSLDLLTETEGLIPRRNTGPMLTPFQIEEHNGDASFILPEPPADY